LPGEHGGLISALRLKLGSLRALRVCICVRDKLAPVSMARLTMRLDATRIFANSDATARQESFGVSADCSRSLQELPR
jgi:hypothetical protein